MSAQLFETVYQINEKSKQIFENILKEKQFGIDLSNLTRKDDEKAAAEFVIYVLMVTHSEAFIYRLITETLQNNVAGEPITHERTDWDFDPEVSQKRRSLFYETHGYRAAKFIDRIGLGVDGREEERRILQQSRDVGRLNGQHNINFPAPT